MPLKLLVSVIILLVAMLVVFLFLLATDTALSVWNYLQTAPPWLQLAYLVILLILPLATLILFWSWFRPGKKSGAAPKGKAREINFDQLQDDLLQSQQEGVDVNPALAEIREQRRRKASGEIHIAIFGEVSSGKSSLVKALLPQANIERDPRAGTTTDIRHYRWTAASGDQVVIADLPGFNLDDDSAAREETRRAHLVIFLCDGDLSSSQARQLDALISTGKPLVLALNKSDRFTADEASAVLGRLRERSGLDPENIVSISAGGREEIVRVLGEDIEQRESRERAPQLESLLQAVQRLLDQDRELMESLRDTSILLLANEKLAQARHTHRQQRADELVNTYSKRAVIGALAAIAPGSDLVIQGVLATQLLRELSKLYDVPVKEMQIESFLKLAGGKLKNMTAITLAITGNALKAFPGLGTISGGLVHAVAYGMIFDSLGKAAAATLESRGELRPYPAAVAFEELMNENLESGAIRFAKIVAGTKKK